MMTMGIGGINEVLTPHRYKLDPAYDNGGWHRLSILSTGMSMCNCYRLTIEPDFNGFVFMVIFVMKTEIGTTEVLTKNLS